MSFDHLYFRTGDPEEDKRREERIAWSYYIRSAMTLAAMPLKSKRIHAQRRCVETQKAKFEKAWRALGEVTQ